MTESHTTKRMRNSKKDKWYAEVMPGIMPGSGEYIWQVRNLRTNHVMGHELTEYGALSYANEINLKGYVDD